MACQISERGHARATREGGYAAIAHVQCARSLLSPPAGDEAATTRKKKAATNTSDLKA